jgi:hypothetical protein
MKQSGGAPRECYAQPLGDCSKGLTREHYISRSVLNEVGSSIWIEGTMRTPAAYYPQSALTARVLCAVHNNQLSDLDTAAADAFRMMRTYQADFDPGAQQRVSKSATVDGSALELWMLKLAFGMLAARQFRDRQRNQAITSVRQGYGLTLLKVLFLREPWPDGWGLYFNAAVDQSFSAPTRADGSHGELATQPTTSDTDGSLWGLYVWFRSFGWLLSFGIPHNLTAQMYRPGALRMQRVGQPGLRTLHLSWVEDGNEHQVLGITRVGEVRP